MGIFSSKKRIKELEEKIANSEIEIKSPCEMFGHTWRDFPPVLEFSWSGKAEKSTIEIIETYVCTCCHQRQEKKLLSRAYTGYDQDYFFDQVREYKKEYKDLIKPEAVVEDMIQDAIMVDRQKLKFWDKLHAAEKPEKEPFEFKIEERRK